MSDCYRVASLRTRARALGACSRSRPTDQTSRATGPRSVSTSARCASTRDLAPPSAARSRRATPRRSTTRPARSRCCSATPRRPGRAMRSPAARRARREAAIDELAQCTGRSGRRDARRHWLNRESPINQALSSSCSPASWSAMRADRARAPRGLRALVASSTAGRPIARRPAGPRPRRLPARQPALRRPARRAAGDRRRLADRRLGARRCTDLAYFLGCALTVEDRRRTATSCCAAYHEGSARARRTLDARREGVRRQASSA